MHANYFLNNSFSSNLFKTHLTSCGSKIRQIIIQEANEKGCLRSACAAYFSATFRLPNPPTYRAQIWRLATTSSAIWTVGQIVRLRGIRPLRILASLKIVSACCCCSLNRVEEI